MTIKKGLQFFAVAVLAAMAAVQVAVSCDTPAPFLFKQAARQKLDSLEKANSTDYLTMAILAHNIAFSDTCAKMSDKAGKYFKKNKLDSCDQALVQAYLASLALIKIRNSSAASKILKHGWSKIPWFGGSSPKDDAYKAFILLSRAVSSEPGNDILKFLRATAAVETAEHLDSVLNYAHRDLVSLSGSVSVVDSASMFFLNHIWAKYWYKRALVDLGQGQARVTKLQVDVVYARNYLLHAAEYACNQDRQYEVNLWQTRLSELENKISDL